MGEWKEYLLSDLIYTNTSTVNKGYQFEKILYLDTGSIICNKIEALQEFSINDAPSRAKRLVDNDDIVYSSVRPNQLHYGFIKNPPQNLVVSTGFVVIKCKKEILHPKFLYYFITQSSITEFLHSIAEGSTSTYPSLKPDDIHELDILLPPLPEQERIAEVLSSLDDKIDLLHHNNKTLEQLAETLFRQWFEKVENEESTTIKNIEEVATVQNGYSFKSSEFITEQPDTLEVLKMGHISAEGGLRPSPKKDFIKRDEKYNKWILNKRDIILAMTDMKDNVVILGVPALIDQDNKYVLNQRVGRISINDGSLIENILILYMQMKDKNFISELQSKGNSGVQVNLGTDTIRQTKVVVPSKDNQRKILPQLESIFDKLDHNRNQVQQLEILRDTLLPKLMSGIVRVEE